MNIQMKNIRGGCSIALLLATLLTVPATSGVCQDKEDAKTSEGKIRLVTSLSNADARKFQFGERLQTKVPEANKNSVGALLLKREDGLTNKPVTVAAKTLYQKGRLYVEVEASAIERMAYQPLEIKIDQKGVNRIVYVAVANRNDKAEQKSRETEPTKPFESNCFLRLDPAMELEARISESEEIEIKSEIGEVRVTLSAIEAILFSKQSGVLSTFVFKNGDKISGQAKLESKIGIETKWGKANLDATRIFMLSRDKETQFIRGTGATQNQYFLSKPNNKPRTPNR